MDILVVIERSEGKAHRMSLESIAAAQTLAGDMSLSCAALVLGADSESAVVAELAALDLAEVLVADHELLKDYSSDGYAQALRQIIAVEQPRYVFMGQTYQSRDYAPKISANSRIPLLSDVLSVRVEEGRPVFIKQAFNAALAAEFMPNPDSACLVSFQASAYSADLVAAGEAKVRSVEVELAAGMIRTRAEEAFQESADSVDLGSAELIVSVGRGLGKEENLPLVRELAETLGAEIGCSRPVVDSGWLPSSRQVGSSGQTVSPKLYLALGISGSAQHLVGMKGASHIIAVNKDDQAPIFEVAEYGVVGDLLEIAPRLTEAIKAAK